MADLTRIIDSKFSINAQGVLVKTATGEPIPDDEPLFLFRGRDIHAISVLNFYRDVCALDPACTNWQVEGVAAAIREFRRFQEVHPERMKVPGITKGGPYEHNHEVGTDG
jgi:hypothetical protein